MPEHCKDVGCGKKAYYGEPGGKRIYCKEHAPEGYVDVKNKRCQIAGCEKHPSHGPASGQPLFCGPHGEERGLKNLKVKRCETAGCNKMPIFGPLGKKASHCKEHGVPLGYTDVKNVRCQKPGCDTRANFGPENGKAMYCAEHGKELGLICLTYKQCEEEGCHITACYGPEDGKPRFCFEHARPHGYLNIVSKRCSIESCTNVASWGVTTKTHCPHHKGIEMRCLVSKRCEMPDCEHSAMYGLPDRAATHCRAHGEPLGMIDVINHRCKNGCQAMTSRHKYDGYCIRCYIHLYPDEPVARNWKMKETHVRHHISALASTDERLKGLQLTFDRALGGCSRRRPDAFLDCFSHAVVIECDENQHASESSYPCENKRMMEIYQDTGHRPLIMIRFNPDKYVDSEGVIIPSCFKYSKKEEVPLPQKKAWKARLNVLTAQILQSVCDIPDRAVTIHHLYYDGFKTPQ